MKKRSLFVSAILVVAMLLSMMAIPAAAAYPGDDQAIWRGNPAWNNHKGMLEVLDFAYFSQVANNSVVIDGKMDEVYKNTAVYDINTVNVVDVDNDGRTYNGKVADNLTVAEVNPARADEAGTDVPYAQWEDRVSGTMRGVWDDNLVYFLVDVNDPTITGTSTTADGDRLDLVVCPPALGYMICFTITPTADGVYVTTENNKGVAANKMAEMIQADAEWKTNTAGDKTGYVVEFSLDMKKLVSTFANTDWFRYYEAQVANAPVKHYFYRDWNDWNAASAPIVEGALFDFNLRIIDCTSKATDSEKEIEDNKNGIHSNIEGIVSWASYDKNSFYGYGTGRVHMGGADVDTITVAGWQNSTEKDGKINLRVLWDVESLYWNNMGFDIDVNGTKLNKEGTTVYTSVLGYEEGAEKEYTAADLDAKYLGALVLNNISTTGKYTITITPYTSETIGGETVKHFGAAVTLEVDAGTVVEK